MDSLSDATALERMLVDKASRAQVPITANFELTPMCNLHCDMCFVRTDRGTVERGGGLQPLERWLRWADEFRQMGTLFILLSGGEPMLHPDFKKLYVSLREAGFILTINTNGTLIDEDMARTFGKLKPRRVNVTLYGASNETYKRLCHVDSGYDRCMNGLRLLKKHGVDTKMNVSAVKGNADDYHKIIETARELDIPAEVNSYMFPYARKACGAARSQLIVKERLSPEQAALAEIEYMEYRKGAAFPQYVVDVKNTLKYGVRQPALGLDCRAAKSSCWINWMGRMTACCVMDRPAVQLVGTTTTVADAWRQLVAECELLEKHNECNECRLRPLCNVCYAAACHEKKVAGSMDFLCKMAAEKERIIQSK